MRKQLITLTVSLFALLNNSAYAKPVQWNGQEFDVTENTKVVVCLRGNNGTSAVGDFEILRLLQAEVNGKMSPAAMTIQDMVDIFGGTGFAGVGAMMLGGDKSLADCDKFFTEGSKKIFDAKLRGWTRGYLFWSEYDDSGLKEVLDETFGDTKMGQSSHDVAVAAFDPKNKQQANFSQQTAADVKNTDIARALVAQPTYFDRVPVNDTNPLEQATPDISLSVLAAVKQKYPETPVLMITIGSDGKPLKQDNSLGWVDFVCEGRADAQAASVSAVHQYLEDTFGTHRYFNFSFASNAAFDETDPTALAAVKAEAAKVKETGPFDLLGHILAAIKGGANK